MSYRDERAALRARIAMLEAKLKEKEPAEGERVKVTLDPRSPWAKRVARQSLVFEGKVTPEGLEAIRHLFWAKLGSTDKDALLGEEAPPGVSLLTHARGDRVFRVVKFAGKTHLSMDHHRWRAGQLFQALVGIGAFVAGAMFFGRVHHDWIQMFMGIYAVAAVFLGPFVYFLGRDQEAKSNAVFESVVELARRHMGVDFADVRVESDERDESATPKNADQDALTDDSAAYSPAFTTTKR